MEILPLAIPGLQLIRPRQFSDDRGVFWETYRSQRYVDAGITETFVQDNLSRSTGRGTVRGLHFQAPPAAQAKLVQCVSGEILDVAVDIRAQSPAYGQWVATTLSATAGEQLYIPAGFAHGFMTLTDDAVVSYKVSTAYSPETEGGLMWNDPDIGIDWPALGSAPVLSHRDTGWPAFTGFTTPFTEDLP